MLECVVNISEGRRPAVIAELSNSCGSALIDLHSDQHHNRSVFTLAGPGVMDATQALAAASISALDLSAHFGVHPRLGVVDVVPFVPLPGTPSTIETAERARNQFAEWLAVSYQIPSFLYGKERTLPALRKQAFTEIRPEFGPDEPHPTAGAAAVGARGVLVAYNLWLESSDITTARSIAAALRGENLRTLALRVGESVQVSCNLVNPNRLGPGKAFDLVAEHAPIKRAELVGLLPRSVLDAEPTHRWSELDIGSEATIESRIGR